VVSGPPAARRVGVCTSLKRGLKMTNSRDPHANPAGCVDALRAALVQEELAEFGRAGPVTERAREAACDLAVAVGRCRLFGSEPGEDLDGTLPAPVALAAAVALAERLRGWAEEASTLGRRWDENDDPIEAEDLCLDLLEMRMDAWAAYVAI